MVATNEDVLKEQEERIESPIVRLLKYSLPYKKMLIIGIIGLVFSVLFDMLPPYIIKIAIDDAIVNENMNLLLWLSISLVGIYLFRSISDYVQNFNLFSFSQEVIYNLRLDTYKHLQQLSLGFFSDNPTGKMMSRLSDDINRLQRFLSETIRGIFRNLIMFLMIGVILFYLNWRLALISLWPIPIISIMTYKFARKIRPRWVKVRESVGDVNSRLHENIKGIEVLKSFGREDYELERVESVSREYRDTNIEAIKLWTKFFPALGFLVSMGSVVIIWYGGSQIIDGVLTVGTLVAFNGYIWKFYEPARMVGWLSNSYQRAAASAARVFGILEEPIDIKMEGGKELDDIDGNIEFDNVTFGYNPDEISISNISFQLSSGQTMALVGTSGAGKSTIIRLLMRFYDVDQGSVMLDGHDIRDINLKQLRRSISIVSQDTFLFDGTIRENICYGDPSATEEDIVEAAKAAAAHEFIEGFNNGYDTKVGEDGVKLSGGQKQRISIARAILSDAKILVLDEATSSVDTITEIKIQKAIENLIEDKTAIIIAHDMSTVRLADKILALKDGVIKERGTHNDLIEKNGLYSKLWKMQSESEDPYDLPL